MMSTFSLIKWDKLAGSNTVLVYLMNGKFLAEIGIVDTKGGKTVTLTASTNILDTPLEIVREITRLMEAFNE